MARKKENLTSAERLEEALVPDWEQPYKVPENWCWTRIAKLCSLSNGKAFKPTDWTKTGIPIVRIQNLNNPEAQYNLYSGAVEDKFRLCGGELLFAWSGTPGTSFGAHIWWGKEAVLNQHIFRVDFDEKYINKIYFKYAINQQLDMLISVAHGGAGLQHVTKGVFEATPIPLPPFAEQQRIVDRIESLFAKLDEARQKAQDALDSFETRKAAILHRAFTGELTAQWRKEHGVGMESWENLKIGTYAQVKGGKRLPKGHKLVTERTTHPYLRIADFGDGTINDSDLNYITEDTFSQIKNYIINKEDVYISIVGSIGKAGVIPESLNGANLTENAARIISSRTLPRYLSSFLSSPKAQNDIQNRIRSATLGKLSLLNIKDIETPVPSIEEQTEIIRFLDDLLAKEQQAKDAAEGVLGQIDLIKKAILTRAFRGELGTNDPSEESAVELLKQISSC